MEAMDNILLIMLYFTLAAVCQAVALPIKNLFSPSLDNSLSESPLISSAKFLASIPPRRRIHEDDVAGGALPSRTPMHR